LSDKRFCCLIIDEASQGTELDCLIPIVHSGASKIILVGDHFQLPPLVWSDTASKLSLGRSFFRRFQEVLKSNQTDTDMHGFFLDTQYRMHPEICRFPSHYVYDGKLKTDTSMQIDSDLNPFIFFDVKNSQEEASLIYPTSWQNRVEADVVALLCLEILRTHQEESIGVITPHLGQKYLIETILKELVVVRSKMEDSLISFNNDEVLAKNTIEVKTVDGYQGGEKDVIIFSCVRAQPGRQNRNVGFLQNIQRLNVALTRAKQGLYIVGHRDTLQVNKHWKALIEDANNRARMKVIEGDPEQIDENLVRLNSEQS
jgi:senataxin